MELCSDCFHKKVCIHKANIQNGTYGYMRMEYDINKCQHYTPASSEDKKVIKHGSWINIQPYKTSEGVYKKAHECSVCFSYFISEANEPYFNHPFCCECGAKMDKELKQSNRIPLHLLGEWR